MSDESAEARVAIRNLYAGTPEPGWSAEFHGVSRADRLLFRAELKKPNFRPPVSVSKEAAEEMRARWLVALDVCDLLSDPDATPEATADAAAILWRASRVRQR